MQLSGRGSYSLGGVKTYNTFPVRYIALGVSEFLYLHVSFSGPLHNRMKATSSDEAGSLYYGEILGKTPKCLASIARWVCAEIESDFAQSRKYVRGIGGDKQVTFKGFCVKPVDCCITLASIKGENDILIFKKCIKIFSVATF